MDQIKHEKIFFDNANYWKPAGNVFAGDCMPFYHNGVFHVYYLWDTGHHNHPLFGSLGGHQWAHISSTDLVHWEHHTIALPLDTENGECSNCTGSLLQWQDKIYAFYSLRSRFFNGEERFRMAVSYDGGYTFPERIVPDLPVPEGTRGQFRDPHAFSGEDGLVHILITAGKDEKGFALGQILHYTTPDLKKFTLKESLYTTLRMPECTDFFRMGKYCYYTYASHWQAHYRMAESLDGKWITPCQDVLTSRLCAVMKSSVWKENRRIGAAWIPTREQGITKFGGNIVFREVVQNPDGTLGTSFVKEMIPQNFVKKIEDIFLESEKGIALTPESTGGPCNFLLEGSVSFEKNTMEFGIVVKDIAMANGRCISFDPVSESMEMDLFDTAKNIPMDPAGIPFKLIMHNGILDMEINGNRTLVAPGNALAGGSRIFFFVRDGKALFRDLALYSW